MVFFVEVYKQQPHKYNFIHSEKAFAGVKGYVLLFKSTDDTTQVLCMLILALSMDNKVNCSVVYPTDSRQGLLNVQLVFFKNINILYQNSPSCVAKVVISRKSSPIYSPYNK